jgi:hypothetical protein
MVEAVVLIGYLLLVFVEALVMAVRKKRAEDAKQQAAKLAPASDAAQETEPESV